MNKQRQSGDETFLGSQRSEGERSEPARSEPERNKAPKNDTPPAPPSSEVSERPERRRFTAAYKLAVVQEADRCDKPGQIGALLRREGLYSSQLTAWRGLRDKGALHGLIGKKRGPKPKAFPMLKKENEQLRRENAKLEKKLAKAKATADERLQALGILS